MCCHIYTHGAQESRYSGCVATKTWKRVCAMKIPKWQGNGIVFPALIVLGNAYVLKTCLKTQIRSCFSCSSSPEPLFLPETLHMPRSKAKETTCSGKNGTSQNHITIAKQCKFKHQQKYKTYNLTYKTFNIT